MFAVVWLYHWRVVPVPRAQGEVMRERGIPVFESSAQAYAVANRMTGDQSSLGDI